MKKEWTNEETREVYSAFNYQPHDFILEQTEEDEDEEDFEPDTQKFSFFELRIQKFAKRIKDGFERNAPDLDSVYGTLLGVALDKVNWYEVADVFIAKIRDMESRLEDADNVLDSDTLQ
jgi:hypothetical protein